MNMSSKPLATTAIMTETSAFLCNGRGYREVSSISREWDSPTSGLFESEYAVVGVVVFETCSELLDSWPEKQDALVRIMSKHIHQQESKSWDGYLVLLTPGIAPSRDEEIERIRYNTNRLRKIVATGEDLRNPEDLERLMSPLLPLSSPTTRIALESALDFLAQLLLETQDVPEGTTRLLIKAFESNLSLMECLHRQSSHE